MKICSFDVGIKNLAYCIIELNNDNFNILKWDIINICNETIKETINCCYQVTDKRKCNIKCQNYYLDNNNKNGLCKNHIAEYDNIIKNKYININTNLDAKCVNKRCKDKCIYIYGENSLCEKHYCTEFKKIKQQHKLLKLKHTNVNYESNFILAKNMYTQLNLIPELLQVDEVIIENQPTLKNPIMKNIASLLFGYFICKGVIESNIKLVKFISPLNKLKIDQDLSKQILAKYTKKYEIKAVTKKLGILYTKQILKNKDIANKLNDYTKIDDLCDAFLQGYNYLKLSYKINKEEIINYFMEAKCIILN